MTHFVGGLYKGGEQAGAAVNALQEAGFQEQDITMLVRKPVKAPEFESRASASDITRSAGIGALLVGLIGALLALLVGTGMIPIQSLFPNFEPGDMGVTVGLTIITFLVSAVTGAIIGAAIKLISSAEKASITPKGVMRGGLLVVVNVDGTQDETARRVMEQNGAVDVENLTEKWDPDIWSRYKGVETP